VQSHTNYAQPTLALELYVHCPNVALQDGLRHSVLSQWVTHISAQNLLCKLIVQLGCSKTWSWDSRFEFSVRCDGASPTF
jgi:hypothetical protein